MQSESARRWCAPVSLDENSLWKAQDGWPLGWLATVSKVSSIKDAYCIDPQIPT
jgi:hypothetical protein